MRNEEVCIWSYKDKYFGIPASRVSRICRAQISTSLIGAFTDGKDFGDFLPADTQVEIPLYHPHENDIPTFNDENRNSLYVLISTLNKFSAFTADKIVFIGRPEDFTTTHGAYHDLTDSFSGPTQEGLASRDHGLSLPVTGNLNTTEHILSFKAQSDVFEISLQQVVRLYSVKDLNPFKLLCDEASGYIFDGPSTVPVVNLGSSMQDASSRIIAFKEDDSVMAVIVDEIMGIQNSGENHSKKLNMQARLGDDLKKNLGAAYEKVFPSPQKKMAELNAQASVNSVIKVDIGETVYVPTPMVLAIQPCPDLYEGLSTWTYENAEIPLVHVPRYYGFSENASKDKSRKILIIENDGSRFALVVNAVIEILQLDRSTEKQVLNWSLGKYSARFKADTLGIMNVADYRTGTFLNVIYLNFDTLLKDKKLTA